MISYKSALKLCTNDELLEEYKRTLRYFSNECVIDMVEDEIIRRIEKDDREF